MSASSAPSSRQSLMMSSSSTGMNSWRIIGGVLTAVTSIAFVVYLIIGVQYLSQPFPGFMAAPTMIVNAAYPTGSETWTGLEAGLKRQDQIIAVNGQPLVSGDLAATQARHVFNYLLSDVQPADPVTLTFERQTRFAEADPAICDPVSNGVARCEVTYELMSLPASDVLSYFLIPYMAGTFILLMGLMIYWLRGNSKIGFLTTLIGMTATIYTTGLFDVGTTAMLLPLWLPSATILGGALVSTGLIFPVPLRAINKTLIQFIPVFAGIVIGMFMVAGYLIPGGINISTLSQTATVISIVGLLMMVGIQRFIQRPLAITPGTRDQNNTLLIGASLMILPALIWFAQRFLLENTQISFVLNFEALMPLYIFPMASITYAVLGYRRFNTDQVISQGITYSIMAGALIVCIFLLTLGGSLLLQDMFDITSPIFITIILFGMVMLFTPFRNSLQKRIDRIYYRQRQDYQQYLEDFSKQVVSQTSYDDVAKNYRHILNETIAPDSIFIFQAQSDEDDYVAIQSNGQTTDIRFTQDSPTVQHLKQQDTAINIQPGQRWSRDLWAERNRLRLLRATILVNLSGADRLNGFIIIGPPRSGKTYDYEQMRFVNNLTRQFAIATERYQVVDSLERRIRELNVISQVGQAVNLTIDFDDLLELISTQTGKLLDARYFYVLLYEDNIQQLRFIFFQEDDERYRDKENNRWTLDNGLFSEVVTGNRALRVDNYAMEMQKRHADTGLEHSGLRAWMGAPLTAGRTVNEVIGVIATARADNDELYSDEEFRIFQDIGALAATSIEKARLFDQTRARERQLTVLNDITRQLVATESDVERLLELIMASAVEILNAEAGSLLLTREDGTGDLEFRVVIGGSGEDLEGTVWKAGEGIVGRVAATGEAVISNNVDDDPGHHDADENYHVKSLLAVPLIAKDDVIGVLEVLNKQDGTIFVEDDSELLTTFAGQAAVAIENARLLRSQDIQLEGRVKELETLEQIDNKLNRAIELSEVAAITVQSAMTNLKAQAGALGIVRQDAYPPHLEIVAIEGYREDEYPDDADGLQWSLDSGIISRVMRTRAPDIVTDVSIDPDYNGKLTDCLSQLTVPMMSGDDINAILILETNILPRFTGPDWLFAQRLAEHASIAIANAQLYSALLSANKSKSEFMGFAAHELKNPLAAVIGYADLVRKGVLGELSEQQQNFLNVIHSNASRMQIIINDLRDSARIEANEFKVDLSPINIRHAVIETLRPFVQQFEEKNQELINNVPDDLPLVMGDQDRLIQVLTNLVSNAHKYSPSDTVVRVEATVVDNYRDETGQQFDTMLRVSVIDQGLGMSEEDQKRLFKEKYFRSSNPVALDQPGTGLGMTLSYNIMRQHGGDIEIKSTLGEGSTFSIYIPLADEPDTGDITPEQQPRTEPASD